MQDAASAVVCGTTRLTARRRAEIPGRKKATDAYAESQGYGKQQP